MSEEASLLVTNTIDIPEFVKTSLKSFDTSLAKGGIQMMTWMNSGSPKSSATPPIRWGVLRGSTTVFVGQKLINVFQQDIKSGGSESPDPLKSYNGKPGIITVVWNTDYAFTMHEERYKPGKWKELGPFSKQAKNATDKWAEKHLAADKEILYKFIALMFKKDMGT